MSEQNGKLCAIALVKGDTVEGTTWFTQELQMDKEGTSTRIKGEIKGLSPGKHGFHIHKYGDMRKGCETAGEHLNPFNKTHGGPEDENRHMGDLGNVEAGSNGVAQIDMTDHQLQLTGPHSIIGRSIVVHKDPDDLGRGEGSKKEESLKTGNSGDRLGCGIIALAEPQ